MHRPTEWLIPSFYGDVKVERQDAQTCRVVTTTTTLRERDALSALAQTARKRGWLDEDATLASNSDVTLRAPIEKVARVLARALKPKRTLVSAIRINGGRIEEIRDAEIPGVEPSQDERPATATTVAVPTRGCPAPDFVRAEIKARRVLEAFLTDEQADDFRRFNRFVSVGAQTGHRYMVTSRHERSQLAYYERSLYDLDERRTLCVHDWTVPAAEEMLALHLMLHTGREHFVRVLEA